MRSLQLGLTLDDLDKLDYGTVIDIMIEHGNDQHKYRYVATQADMDRF